MNLLIGLIAGVIGYFVATLVFPNQVISGLIGLVIFAAVAFGFDRYHSRRVI